MERIPRDEETRVLLRRILENQAYRQLMLENIRGHGIKYLPEPEAKAAAAEQIAHSLRPFRALQSLYAELCGADVLSAVRGKMERIPYPGSRMELAVCLFVCKQVERAALSTYVDSCARDLAAIARTRLEFLPARQMPADAAFAEFCADPSNRPHAQQMFDRWLSICLLSLGRPGSHGDERAVALGLRNRGVGEIVAEFLNGLTPFLSACSLVVPDEASLSVQLPQGWRARTGSATGSATGSGGPR